jgi:ABC-type transport system substrate-binding protein
MRTFADVKAVDDYTLQIRTKDITRILLNDLEQIAIIPDTVGMQGTDAYNTGEAMIGTGPYRLEAR